MKEKHERAGFKVLTPRDIQPGRAQGPLIPVELRAMFPPLPASTAASPIPAHRLSVTYLDTDGKEHKTESRYHQQTRGRRRAGETWVTGDLAPFLSGASPGDMLFISCNEGDFAHYRFHLFKQDTPEFRAVISQIQPGLRENWGILTVPSGSIVLPYPTQIQREKSFVLTHANSPFQLEDPDARRSESHARRYIRDRGFHEAVVELYQRRCAFCLSGLSTPDGLRFEVEAAHIRPKSRRGPDDVRNDFALCRTHHWAFDVGVVSVHPDDRTVMVSSYLPEMSDDPGTGALNLLANRPVLAPIDAACGPAKEALEWHMHNSFIG